MLESKYQGLLIKDLERMFPGCVILKNDAQYRQGFPDLLILFRDKWAALEVKASYDSPEQPNQDYYISLLQEMSFAAFIFPENEEEVLFELKRAFR